MSDTGYVSEFVLQILVNGDISVSMKEDDGLIWEMTLDPNDAIGLAKVLDDAGKKGLEKKEAMLIA